ncbi:unnamed protein product [Sphagnum tenellum]
MANLMKNEVTLGWATQDEFLGTQCILAKPNSIFVKLWLQTYYNYKPHLWYYNAGEYPTTHILKPCPDLVHREKELLGVQNLAYELYSTTWSDWRDYYAIHLLYRHRTYLNVDDVKSSNITNFDEEKHSHLQSYFWRDGQKHIDTNGEGPLGIEQDKQLVRNCCTYSTYILYTFLTVNS